MLTDFNQNFSRINKGIAMSNFCQECGSPRDENAKFCPNCGFKFHQEAKEEIEPTKEVEAPKEVENKEETNQANKATPNETQDPKIGGWLYLFAFALIFSLIVSFGELIQIFFDKEIWGGNIKSDFILGNINLQNIKIAWGVLFVGLVFDSLLFFLHIYAIFAFFTKSKNTRFVILLFCVLSFICSVVSLILGVGKDEYSSFGNPRVGMVSSVIWFLYFLLSKRVKRTFVKDFSKKTKWTRIIFSSIVPITILAAFLVKSGIYMSDLDEAKKKYITDLTSVRKIFENPDSILKEFRKRKEGAVKQEIRILVREYSLKNKNLNTKSEIINFIYNNPEYANLFQGIIYFCGLDCSPIPQDLEKSYYYLNNLPYNQKEEMAMFLAKMELYGIGTKQSLANAVRNASYATSLDKASQATQYYYFGLGYLYGEYYEKNIDKAIDCLKKSADLGDSSSAFLSAILMATEPKGRYNDQTIIYYFKRAILLNNMVAERYLAYYYYNNNEHDLAKQTLQQCSKTNPECQTAYQELFK